MDDLTLQVLYLAHDLADAAIRRRVLTLKAGGADVTVAGFTRGRNLLSSEVGVTSIVLGETADARFVQRIGAVASARMSLGRKLAGVTRPDVIIARNIETLALAGAAADLFGADTPIVYECLDIHRLLLDEGIKGQMMRAAQRRLGARAKLLITSSPAFVENFFQPLSGLDLPVLLLENKVLALDGEPAATGVAPRPPEPGKPWRIGWFGAIRCAKSLGILIDFAARMEGKVEIVLRGRPAHSEFADFDALVAAAPHVEFHGAYRNPEDLSGIYNDVQFTWAIDFFEEGLNSDWLLPNRLYEGSLHGAVPITLSTTETGRFVARRDMGVTLDAVTPDALQALFSSMDTEAYGQIFSRLTAIDRSQWVTDAADCRALVARLGALDTQFPPPAALPVLSTEQSRGVVMVSREPSHAPENVRVNDAVSVSGDVAVETANVVAPALAVGPAPAKANAASVAATAIRPLRAAYNFPVADDPRTLIVIPALNEAATIDALIRKLDKQREGYDALIVVADGGSRDGTQDIVKQVAQEIPGVVLLNNPKKIQSAAINLAVRRFGDDRDYLIRIDAHGDYPDNYCRALIEEAKALQADSVVVGMETVGFGTFQKATAIAQNSRLGNGGSKHRAGGGGQWIDHGHHALMQIAAFLAVGGYDESFSHNEDAELDYRLREMGFRIWMTSKTYMTYYPRSSAAALFRQYLGYGRGRARNLLKHRSIPKVRQAIPLAVAPVVIGAVLALMYWWAAVPFVLWAAACLGYGFWMAVGHRNPYGPLAAVSAMIMHFAWSAGFWLELIGIRKRSVA